MTTSTLRRPRSLVLALLAVLALGGAPLHVAHAGDRDGDGISNKLDRCPDEAEDLDGYQDEDGCLDPSTRVHLVVQDADGQPVSGVAATLVGDGGEGTGGGDWQVEVHHGTYTLTARAPGFRPVEDRVIVPEQDRFEVVTTLDRLEGRLGVRVVDEAGQPIPGAVVAFDKGASSVAATGLVQQTLPPGDHIVKVTAPGFVASMKIETVEADGERTLQVVLEPLVRDRDGDGIVDERDACPDAAEDVDGFQDIDGCPDPRIPTHFRFTDAMGRLVRDVDVRVMGAGGDGKGGADFTLDLHPGTYDVFATAESYEKVDQQLEVPADRTSWDATFTMARVWTTLILYVMDPDGRPIDKFRWNLDNNEDSPGDGGGLYAGKMDPGAHVLFISSDGYAPAKANIDLEPGKFAETSITLYPTLIQVRPDKIEISDKVYFDTAKATIKQESFPLLDQVAAVMKARTDMLRVRVEGHTDSRGSAESNRRLSDARAASVRDYLVTAGIAPERLSSVGKGEDEPVDPRDTEEAWDRNRRVEFIIEEWADVKVDKQIEPRQATVEVKTTTEKPPVWEGFGILDGSPPPLE